jgi:hypothetical protein
MGTFPGGEITVETVANNGVVYNAARVSGKYKTMAHILDMSLPDY